MLSVEPDPRQRLARPRALIQSQPVDPPIGTRLNSFTLRTGPLAAIAKPGKIS